MLTYQDYERAADKLDFLRRLRQQHEGSEALELARIATCYDRQQNVTICEFVRRLYTLSGRAVQDYTASNHRIASNFFSRLVTQRAAYSLGNGISFARPGIKERLGEDVDERLFAAGRLAIAHGAAYLFWNVDRLHVFPMTEFAPLYDEGSGALRAGLRYWRIAQGRPIQACFYEEAGMTRLVDSGEGFCALGAREAYRPGEAGRGALPIVPLYGSRYRQSAIVGMRQAIDSFDLIRSGFADDLADCAEIYWLLENVGGMSDAELARFRDRLKFTHIAQADTGGEGRVTPYVQQVPYEARMAYLDHIRSGIYEDFGALDVSRLASGKRTATEIRAAYQPLDEQADDFEYQVIGAVRALTRLFGKEATPIFARNRIADQAEQVKLVMAEQAVLDRETILRKLPNISVDEVSAILARPSLEETARERAEREEEA